MMAAPNVIGLDIAMLSLVTGAAGFIGSHIVDRLLAEGHRVIGIDNFSGGRPENIAHLKGEDRFDFREMDICEHDALAGAMRNVDRVFHIAGIGDIVPSIEAPLDYHRANVDGTVSCLEAARANGVSRFLYAASSTCYGLAEIYPTPEDHPIRPEYPYALTKYMGEELVLHWAHASMACLQTRYVCSTSMVHVAALPVPMVRYLGCSWHKS